MAVELGGPGDGDIGKGIPETPQGPGGASLGPDQNKGIPELGKEVEKPGLRYLPFQRVDNKWRTTAGGSSEAYDRVVAQIDKRSGSIVILGVTTNGDETGYDVLTPDQSVLVSMNHIDSVWDGAIGVVGVMQGDTETRGINPTTGDKITLERKAFKDLLIDIPLTDEDLLTGIDVGKIKDQAGSLVGEYVTPKWAFAQEFRVSEAERRVEEHRAKVWQFFDSLKEQKDSEPRIPGSIRGLTQVGNRFIPRGADPESARTPKFKDVYVTLDRETNQYTIWGHTQDGMGDLLLNTDLQPVFPHRVYAGTAYKGDEVTVGTDKYRWVKITPHGVLPTRDDMRERKQVRSFNVTLDLVRNRTFSPEAIQRAMNLEQVPVLAMPGKFEAFETARQERSPGLHADWKFEPLEKMDTVHTTGGESARPLFEDVSGMVDPLTGAVAVVGRNGETRFVLDDTYKPVAYVDQVFPKSKRLVAFTLPADGFTGQDLAVLASEGRPGMPRPQLAGSVLLDYNHLVTKHGQDAMRARPQDARFLPQEHSLPDLQDPASIFPEVIKEGKNYMLKTPAFGHEQYKYQKLYLALDTNTDCLVPMGGKIEENTLRMVAINPQTFEPMSEEFGYPVRITDSEISDLALAWRGKLRAVKADGVTQRPIKRRDRTEKLVTLVDISDALVMNGSADVMRPLEFMLTGSDYDTNDMRWGFTTPYKNRFNALSTEPTFRMPNVVGSQLMLDERIAGELERIHSTGPLTMPGMHVTDFQLPAIDKGGMDHHGTHLNFTKFYVAVDTQTRTVGLVLERSDGMQYLSRPDIAAPLTPGAHEIIALGDDGIAMRLGNEEFGVTTGTRSRFSHTPESLLKVDITDRIHAGGLTAPDMLMYAYALAGNEGMPIKHAFQTRYTLPGQVRILDNYNQAESGPPGKTLDTFQFPKFYNRQEGFWDSQKGFGLKYDDISLIVDSEGRLALIGTIVSGEDAYHQIIGPDQRGIGPLFRDAVSLEDDAIIYFTPSTGNTTKRSFGSHFTLPETLSSEQVTQDTFVQIPIPDKALETGISLSDMRELAAQATGRPSESFYLGLHEVFSNKLGLPESQVHGPVHPDVAAFAKAYLEMSAAREGEDWPELPSDYVFPKVDISDESNGIKSLYYAVDAGTGKAALVADIDNHEYLLHPGNLTPLTPPVNGYLAFQEDRIIAEVANRIVAITDEGVTDLGPFSYKDAYSRFDTLKFNMVEGGFSRGTMTVEKLINLGKTVIPDPEVRQTFLRVPTHDSRELPTPWYERAGELSDDAIIGSKLSVVQKRELRKQNLGDALHGYSVAVDPSTNRIALVEMEGAQVAITHPTTGEQETMNVTRYYIVNPITGTRQTEIALDQFTHFGADMVTGVHEGEVVVIDNGRFDILTTADNAQSTIQMVDVTRQVVDGTLTGAGLKRLAAEISNADSPSWKLVDPREGMPVGDSERFRNLNPQIRTSILIDALGSVVANESLPPDFRQNLIEANSFLIGIQGAEEAIDHGRLEKGARSVNVGTWRVVLDALHDWHDHSDTYTAQAAAEYLNRLDPEGEAFGNNFRALMVPDMETFEVLVEYLMAREIANGVDPEVFATANDLQLLTIMKLGAQGMTDVLGGGMEKIGAFMRKRID